MSIDLDRVTPCNDEIFRSIFADPKHKRLLIHLLNSVINSCEPETDFTISNIKVEKTHIYEKGSRLDIKATTNTVELISVELLLGIDRLEVVDSLDDTTNKIVLRLCGDKNYSGLNRTIVVSFLDFDWINDDGFCRMYSLTKGDPKGISFDPLLFLFVELHKMKKCDEKNALTFWIEFLRNPYSDACMKLYKQVPELLEAKQVFEAVKADPKKRQLIEDREVEPLEM